jgi:hypothetical protein
MGFESKLYPREEVINDETVHRLCTRDPIVGGEAKLFGRVPRDYGAVPYGSLEYMKPFDIPLIPRSKWPDLVAEMEAKKTRVSDLLLSNGIPSLDQDGTNYCWFNAVTGCVVVTRLRMGLPYEALSPASGAAQLKNYRNEGGWGGEALQWITKNGVASAAVWPPNAISRKYKTPESDADALNHVVTEWYDLESRNFDQMYTMLLLGIPVAIGLNWWSHEVMACDPVWQAGKPLVRFRNSWSDSYGDKGFNVLSESKATPDDACCPTVAKAA